MTDSEDQERYVVVVNHEEQYSIWPEAASLPLGWTREGTAGSKETCLERIRIVWTDLRPRSLRDAMSRD